MEEDELRISQNPGEVAEETIFKVVMLRCGEIEWDVRNIYCGWYDSKLTAEGRKELITTSNILKVDNYSFDLAYCSALSRCRDSLSIILNELELEDIEIQPSWQLNERHCGCFTGYRKDEINEKYGSEQISFWMNTFTHSPPPITPEHRYYNNIYDNGLYPKNESLPFTESLEMIQKRVVDFWCKNICPSILSGRKILIVTHNKPLQVLIQYLDGLEFNDFTDIELPRSTPFYYKFDETLTPILKDSYKSSTIPISNDLERKIADAFEIFDHAGNKNVDIREIGTIIRSLGCVPSEAELQEILVATENHEATGCVHLSAFLPKMVQIFNEHKFQPATPDKLLEAFRKFDQEKNGYINKEYFTKILMEEGEPFNEEEHEEMMSAALDPKTQTIPYEYYINQLMIE